MLKIFLAVGVKDVEDFIKESNSVAILKHFLKTDVVFTGETVYREGILPGIANQQPDIIVIREGLNGKKNIMDIIYEIKLNYADTRIVFLAGDRDIGDALLANLVQIGVYDIIVGSILDCTQILKKIIEPSKLADVAMLLPKISVDERTNQKIFEAPNIDINTIKQDNAIKPIKNLNLKSLGTQSNEEKPSTLKEETEYEEEIYIDEIEEAIEEPSTTEIKKISLKKVEEEELIIEDEEELIIKDDEEELIIEEEETLIIEDEENNSLMEEEELIIEEEEEVKIVEEIEKKTPPIAPSIIPLSINMKKENIAMEKPIKEPVIEKNKPLIKKPFNKIDTRKNEQIDKELNIKSEGILKKNKINTPPVKQENIKSENSGGGFFGKIFGNKKEPGRINQQILTFMGGKSGVGNSQIAFNTALNLAESGYRVIYLDLNDKFSSIDYIFQLGYSDVGIDTALEAFEDNNFNAINLSITNASKILSNGEEDNFLYKTYNRIPKTLDFLFFSQQYMDKFLNNQPRENVKPELLKELNMYLLMTGGYDFIILDCPSDINYGLTEIALIYSTKIFFTITQDISVIGNHLKDTKLMRKKGINFEEKFYYLINKNENASMNSNNIYDLLSESLMLDNFNMITIPNISKDLINSNYAGLPLLWNVKSKEFRNAFSNINKLIF